METSCVNICDIDRETGLCMGCGRTIDEIARWATMTSRERRRIMTVLTARKAADLKG
jgi:predicted Fe-S protein YdhL (DUF1289 family)